MLASVRVPLVKWRCGRRQEESQRHKIFSSIPVQVEGNHFQYGGHGSTRSLELWCSTGRRLLSLLAEWRLHNFGVVPEVPDESSLSGLRIWMSTLPCLWREEILEVIKGGHECFLLRGEPTRKSVDIPTGHEPMLVQGTPEGQADERTSAAVTSSSSRGRVCSWGDV